MLVDIPLNFSIGLATSPTAESLDAAFQQADRAMYLAKSTKKIVQLPESDSSW